MEDKLSDLMKDRNRWIEKCNELMRECNGLLEKNNELLAESNVKLLENVYQLDKFTDIIHVMKFYVSGEIQQQECLDTIVDILKESLMPVQ